MELSLCRFNLHQHIVTLNTILLQILGFGAEINLIHGSNLFQREILED